MDIQTARAWLDSTLTIVGAGFHWDTPGEDYVNADSSPVFSDPDDFNAQCDAAYQAFVESGHDPYAIALERVITHEDN